MGMIANYQPTTDIELEKITCLDDVEEAQEFLCSLEISKART